MDAHTERTGDNERVANGERKTRKVEQGNHWEVITCDALIVTGVKQRLDACVCFGDGQRPPIGKRGEATGRIREGRRAGKG